MNVALILSGGTGSRLGADVPKQYLYVRDRMILSYCAQTIINHEGMDAVHIVAASCWQSAICEELKKIPNFEKKFRGFSEPGENRQLSIYHGLCDIQTYAGEDAYVLIHDGARPLLSEQLITSCLEAISGHDGVMPVLPMKDTVYTSEDGSRVSGLLNRDRVYAGQAPELFLLGPYRKACETLLPDRIRQINGSSEPAVLAGLDLVMVPGDERNYKITTREDLERFQE